MSGPSLSHCACLFFFFHLGHSLTCSIASLKTVPEPKIFAASFFADNDGSSKRLFNYTSSLGHSLKVPLCVLRPLISWSSSTFLWLNDITITFHFTFFFPKHTRRVSLELHSFLSSKFGNGTELRAGRDENDLAPSHHGDIRSYNMWIIITNDKRK